MTFLKPLAVALALASTALSGAAWADPYTDEANRQAQMASMRAQDAANDRAAADRAFQAGLAQQRNASSSSGSGSSYSSGGGSGTALDGLAAALRSDPVPSGPQSVVATRTVIVRMQETPAQVVARLRSEAGAGNAESAFNLARVLYTGYGGVPRDDAEARRWFTVAADAGNADAQAQAGYMAHEGLGGPIDLAAALAQTGRAAAQGNAYGAGLNGLYRLTADPDGPAQPAAVANLEKAAAAGHLFAQVALGTIVYELGVGTEVDWDKAARYAKMGADAGHPLAQLELGRMMMTGRGTRQDAAGGAALIRKAAEAGHPAAMGFLGQLFLTGQGMAKNESQGWQWFKRAADAGDGNAAGVYGLALFTGQGLRENTAEGLRYLRLGMERGDAQAQTGQAAVYRRSGRPDRSRRRHRTVPQGRRAGLRRSDRTARRSRGQGRDGPRPGIAQSHCRRGSRQGPEVARTKSGP